MKLQGPISKLFVVCLISVGGASDLWAKPDIPRHYRFVPQRSVLTEIRDEAETDFSVHGTFDFTTSSPNLDWPVFASFENVDAWAAHPILDYVLDLNDVLGMETLEGEQLPVAAPWDAFAFEGKNKEGSDVRLDAMVLGSWFIIHGNTTPPPDRDDLFAYEFNAWAHERPFPDFNDDAVVTAADLAVWSEHFGMGPLLGDATTRGDATGDGAIDGSDFLAWQQAVGQSWLPEFTSIPEPSGVILLDAAAAWLYWGWRRRC